MSKWFVFFAVALAPSLASAAPVFYFTGPYRGLADSPFDTSGLGSTFFVEDFEDGVLDQTGLTVMSSADVLGPGSGALSVEDDGHSLKTTNGYDLLIKPTTIISGLTFSFDAQLLGFHPTDFGFAFMGTDALPTAWTLQMLVRAYGSSGEMVGEVVRNLGDLEVQPFIGVRSDGGLSRVEFDFGAVEGGEPFFQIDHLQFGVPEPGGAELGLVALMIFVAFGFRRFVGS